jgi:hypothetical protein
MMIPSLIVVYQTTFGAKEDALVVRQGGMASMSPIPCLEDGYDTMRVNVSSYQI